jgi:3D (Asp-Asp-Asp) domain-containing protein
MPAPQMPAPQTSSAPVTTSFTATAYCTGAVTASGALVARGGVAADPKVLPLGTVIRVERLGEAYDGTYTVTDTGPSVRGRRIDLYVPNCREAKIFGRRSARVAVVRVP